MSAFESPHTLRSIYPIDWSMGIIISDRFVNPFVPCMALYCDQNYFPLKKWRNLFVRSFLLTFIRIYKKKKEKKNSKLLDRSFDLWYFWVDTCTVQWTDCSWECNNWTTKRERERNNIFSKYYHVLALYRALSIMPLIPKSSKPIGVAGIPTNYLIIFMQICVCIRSWMIMVMNCRHLTIDFIIKKAWDGQVEVSQIQAVESCELLRSLLLGIIHWFYH